MGPLRPTPPANLVISRGALYGTEAASITAAVSVLGCVGDPYPGMRYTSLPGAIVLVAYPEHSAHSPSPGSPVQSPEVPLVRSRGPYMRCAWLRARPSPNAVSL